MWIKRLYAAAGLVLATGALLHAETPMSAIDWLSDSVTTPVVLVPPAQDGDAPEAAVTESAAVEEITVTPLDMPSPDAVGLLPVSVTGLPRDLWGASDGVELARLIRDADIEALPASRELLYLLLLAELDPPAGADGSGALFLARIDKLLDLGALEQAQALLEQAGPGTPVLFRRWFDVALLTGTEDLPCETLRMNADFSPTFPARIFCLARGGDWNAAALTLATAKALGHVTDEEDALLARFLDGELFEGAPPLRAPTRPSPLVFRMREAIGEPIPTASLPRAFAQADLRSTAGWKAQIEAAERLARVGAIDENRLLGLYTERRPAASGGVWDRVDAVQRFDVAYRAADPGAVSGSLPAAWAAAEQAGLEMQFAALYGAGLATLPLSGTASELAFRIGLLSDAYEDIAAKAGGQSAEARFLRAVALGEAGRDAPPDSAVARAIGAAFAAPGMPPAYAQLVADDRLGEALLKANVLLASGARGDTGDLTDALRVLRAVGLERIARQAALQLMLLDRTG